MEVRQTIRYFLTRCCMMLLCIISSLVVSAQLVKKYTVRDGKMVIELTRQIPEKELEEFITNFDLADLDLKGFFKTNNADSLRKQGWTIEKNTQSVIILSKPLFAMDMKADPAERIFFANVFPFNYRSAAPGTTASGAGYNKFRKQPFAVKDSVVVFVLRGHENARKVLLAGSFTGWQQHAFPMGKTDSGWSAMVKLPAGKHYYKFIVDDRFITDPENQLTENDGSGNINSVYYKTNFLFSLDTFRNARRVYLSGSFNNWRERELLMSAGPNGWEIPLLLPEGTHTYKFIVDGRWMADPANPSQLPDGHGQFNSVIRFGNTHLFQLKGYLRARKVILAGNFNGWKEDELLMERTDSGWQLPYTIGPGNYQYKFIVDGRWMADPANPLTVNDGNSFLVLQPNYTFILHAPAARSVYIAGDFNGWDPQSLPMKKVGDEWRIALYLSPGKHRYKFVIDGEWKLDPANKLWEQNEYRTGNSIIWMEQ